MKSTKILTILIVGVVSVSLLARVERPDKVPKAFEEMWNALLDLQEQIDNIQPIPGPPGPTLGIYDSLGLPSSGGREPGDSGGRILYNLGDVGIGTTISSGAKLNVQGAASNAINCNSESGQGVWAKSQTGVGVAGSSPKTSEFF